MKVTLVFFEQLADDPHAGFGHASLLLARALQTRGRLRRVIHRRALTPLGLEPGTVKTMFDHPGWRLAARILGRLGQWLPWVDMRRWQEWLFDRFARGRLTTDPGDLVFCSRPLMPDTVRKARQLGHQVWVLSAVPHPLKNFALIRTEEIRWGLPARGGYSNLKRAERLARTIAHADRLVTPHPDLARYTYDSFLEFLPPERLVCLKNFMGTDPNAFAVPAQSRSQAPQEICFLHISHINLIKGVTYLLEAWRKLQDMAPGPCRLVLVGVVEKRLRGFLRQRFGDLPGVEFRGFQQDLQPHLAEANVFVSPSLSDAGPATIIEAMAAGLPVIASRNCGFASLITEGQNGFTYPYCDTELLARHLLWFTRNPAELPRLAVGSRDAVAHRSIAGYAEELMASMVDPAGNCSP